MLFKQTNNKYFPSYYKTELKFEDNELEYSFTEDGKKVGNSISYDLIPDRVLFKLEKPFHLFKYIFICYISFIIIIISYDLLFAGLSSKFLYASTLITSALFIYNFFQYIYKKPTAISYIQTHPLIAIIHDGQQKIILGEINKRRYESRRKKEIKVNFDKPYYKESIRFKWLREDGIISEEELLDARKKIAAMRNRTNLYPSDTNKIN
ncbi:MAG: hypothetical protein R3D71_00825 [Rickettsiales bacterium]